MPTYEYACEACGHQWEEVQRITAAPLEVCPKCSEPKAHRLISGGTNFILKGGGWYSDLYASPKAETKKTEASASGGEAASASKAETTTKSESGTNTSSSSSSGGGGSSGGGTTASTPSTSTPSSSSSA